MNVREVAVVRYLVRNGAAGLESITYGCDRTKLGRPGRRAWWVRNAVRRPLRDGLIERVDEGVYRVTQLGRATVAPRKTGKSSRSK